MASSNTKQILKKVGIKLTTPKIEKNDAEKSINFPLMSLLDDLKNMPYEKRIEHLFKVFGPNYFNLNFDKRRMLFTPKLTTRVKKPFSYAECGGVMIDYENCEIVSVAPSPINTITYGNVSDKYNYHVVYHGTQLTLYWDKHDGAGKWCLQTANGVDASNKVNRGIAFKDAFAECLEKTGLSLESYDKGSSHTFIIRHPKMHPLKEENDMYAILLVSVKLADLKNSVSLYKLRNNIENINDVMLPLKVKGDFKKTVHNYREHLKFIQTGDLEKYASTGETFYGIIARSRTINEKYPAGISVMIESDLQKALRQCVYNLATIDDIGIDVMNWAHQSKEYLMMFPEKKTVYERFDTYLLPKVADQILANDKNEVIQSIRIKLLNDHPGLLTTDHARANVLDLIKTREYAKDFVAYLPFVQICF